ncbi:RagB/SusD family nutrient uptake outer membrane protein [Sphingobacterium paucimobilis]|uniref:RagB/SusD domain-containing protein n=1 Tax=Sphingobacterium paucimobilis HER1398 TaxID=1346330 RepID=U2HRG6_9SPHI|nr:RagB/SusD family nutrient uptake outer membrane protein [Sphingobacterium paucimobilis]ERJ57890.1 hypothetical protein M472_03830 [Sphingobacterium paucimobilis HER1398]ERJ60341.1 hypothetical protein M472_16400 [Sphingobacterium paucimobilis HER1398]
MKFKYFSVFIVVSLVFTSCEKFLERGQLTAENDDTAWTTEAKVRLYANKYYTDYFVGYGAGFTTTDALLESYTKSDDILSEGTQADFLNSVPVDKKWKYENVRSINIMIDRVENRMSNILAADAYSHWLGIGKFFRAMAYVKLVNEFGDVPYYDKPIDETDVEQLYKQRTPRNEVMDAVYDDMKFAFENVRVDDGKQNVNRYIVAGFISRMSLAEGAWQKYYYKNNERAKKFFELAKSAGDYVINSGKYAISTPYREQFTSDNIENNKDILLSRTYNAAIAVQHSIASKSNLTEIRTNGPTTDLIKSYLCTDGQVWQNSTAPEADNFEVEKMMGTRDPRFEATFHYNTSDKNRASYLYVTKFLPRTEQNSVASGKPSSPNFQGANNTTAAPILRYAEVLLNWIEAKAELELLGEGAVAQVDIDQSINKIRQRPLGGAPAYVKQVADMKLNALPHDPDRDISVTPLLWEIRRERRVEMTFEYSRLEDLKRWSKLEYMEMSRNPDILSGAWVNFPAKFPNNITNDVAVIKMDGTVVKYDGDKTKMIGFYRNLKAKPRIEFIGLSNTNPYLAPVGLNQIDFYKTRGYVLKQTEGWPQN